MWGEDMAAVAPADTVTVREPLDVPMWMVFVLGFLVVVSLLWVGAILWFNAPLALAVVGMILLALGVLLAVGWLKKSFFVVGEEQRPRVALIVRWGRVIAACNQGLFFRAFPIDKIVKFRTTQYTIQYDVDNVFTKAGDGEESENEHHPHWHIERFSYCHRICWCYCCHIFTPH